MKKIITAAMLLSLILALGILGGCQDKIAGEGDKEQTVLRMGTEPTYPPFEYMNDANEIIGFDIDLAEAIAGKLGMELEIIPTAFDGIFTGMNAGSYDVIIAAVSMTPKRLENMILSTPYLSNGQVVLTRKGDKAVKTHDDLRGMSVGVQLGTTADTAADKYAGEYSFEVTKYDEIIQTFSAMKAGHVDAVAADYAVAIEYVKREPKTYEISPVMLTNEPIAIAMKKDNTALEEKINEALKELREEGTLKAISEKWLGDDYTSDIDEALNVIE